MSGITCWLLKSSFEQAEQARCGYVEILGISRERINKRISIASIEGLTCLTWLDAAATSAEYKKCPLKVYPELSDLAVS